MKLNVEIKTTKYWRRCKQSSWRNRSCWIFVSIKNILLIFSHQSRLMFARWKSKLSLHVHSHTRRFIKYGFSLECLLCSTQQNNINYIKVQTFRDCDSKPNTVFLTQNIVKIGYYMFIIVSTFTHTHTHTHKPHVHSYINTQSLEFHFISCHSSV